ncbi:MAG: glutamine-hydrolyzing GMP synthase [Defluviitaleaceae bacterium]|nr:glutamine-hydrolyzing GMP synthase [Defluviitaleaceae bacterium]
MKNQLILILDFGGQYKELIASTVRSLGVYSEIKAGNIPIDEIKKLNPIGIILTGGPNSVYEDNAPIRDKDIFNLGIPIFGICYGMQLMTHVLGGIVSKGKVGEYGTVLVERENGDKFNALMSHRDVVEKLPEGFIQLAKTANCIAEASNHEKKLFMTQYHPEAKHTEGGRETFKNFLFRICGAKGDYSLDDFIEVQMKNIREQVGNGQVLLALSGGVDSAVCATILSKAIPGQLTCIFVDHGFMRLNESEEIEEVFAKRNLNFIRVNASDRFLAKIKDIFEPEKKRKLIGEEFVRVFENEAKKINADFLAQGTIYPDIVESGGTGEVIKSHHNVGGLPKDMGFKGIVEPLSQLFKDEVREVGRKLGLPNTIVERQPFPGPGLAIRIMGNVTYEKLEIVRLADAFVREELDKLQVRPNQYFAVLTDTLSVGVKGDARTYDPVVAVRAVITEDFMTADYFPVSHDVLGKMAKRITSELPVSRVVYDISPKPPATVEWE